MKDFSWPTAWLGLAIVLPPLLLSVPLFWNTSPVNQGLALFGAGASPAGLWLALFGADDLKLLGHGLVAAATAGCVAGMVVYSLWAWRLWRAALARFPEAVGRRG